MADAMDALFLAHGDKIRKVEEVARWRIRKLLATLPAKPPATARGVAKPARVAYLFAGTYGDFVQVLPTLRRLAAAYPSAWAARASRNLRMRSSSMSVPPPAPPAC